MLLSLWQRVARRGSNVLTNRNHNGQTRKGRGSPQIESLETRDLLSVFAPSHLLHTGLNTTPSPPPPRPA
jgi:hypothetical protein